MVLLPLLTSPPFPGSERVVLSFNSSSFYQALAEINILFNAFLSSNDLSTVTACWERRGGHHRCVLPTSVHHEQIYIMYVCMMSVALKNEAGEGRGMEWQRVGVINCVSVI